MGFLIFCFGFIAGWFTFRHFLNKKVNEIYDIMDDELKRSNDKAPPKRVSIKFEKYNGSIYVYNRENDNFLTQGKTYQEIVKNLEEQFPEITFLATPGALKQIQK